MVSIPTSNATCTTSVSEVTLSSATAGPDSNSIRQWASVTGRITIRIKTVSACCNKLGVFSFTQNNDLEKMIQNNDPIKITSNNDHKNNDPGTRVLLYCSASFVVSNFNLTQVCKQQDGTGPPAK